MITAGSPASTSSAACRSTGAGSAMIIVPVERSTSSSPNAYGFATGSAERASPSKRIAASASYATR